MSGHEIYCFRKYKFPVDKQIDYFLQTNYIAYHKQLCLIKFLSIGRQLIVKRVFYYF